MIKIDELTNLFSAIIEKRYPIAERTQQTCQDLIRFISDNELATVRRENGYVEIEYTIPYKVCEKGICTAEHFENIIKTLCDYVVDVFDTLEGPLLKAFLEELNDLTYYVLPDGKRYNELLKPDSEAGKQYSIHANIAQNVVKFAIEFGRFDIALKYYNTYILQYRYPLRNFLSALYSYSYEKWQKLRGKNTLSFDEYLNELLEKNNLQFLYQIQGMLQSRVLQNDDASNIKACVDNLIAIVDFLRDKLCHNKHLSYFCEKFPETGITLNKLLHDDELYDYIHNGLEKDWHEISNSFDPEEYADTQKNNRIDVIYNSLKDLQDHAYYLDQIIFLENPTGNPSALQSMLDKFNVRYSRLLLRSCWYDAFFGVGESSPLLLKKISNLISKKNEERFNDKLKRLKNVSTKEKKEYCIRFFNFLETYNSHPAMTAIEIDEDEACKAYKYSNHPFHFGSNEYYAFIQNNASIVNALTMAEMMLETEEYMTCEGDYTCYVVGQIKVVERLLKEILVQKYPDKIYKSSRNKYDATPIRFDDTSSLSADDLSSDINSMELGGVTLAMSHILSLENPRRLGLTKRYNGIFSIRTERNSLNEEVISQKPPFYRGFIAKVRNGYFHIHQIETYEQALKNSRLVSYWMCRIIDEMIYYHGSEFKLR